MITILYWWPKPSIWAASGFNLGYWSEVAEDWFRHHHKEIWNSIASPWTNKHWKNVLAHYKHSRTFIDKIENVSARFVSGERFGWDELVVHIDLLGLVFHITLLHIYCVDQNRIYCLICDCKEWPTKY
jgi:hypothetical protein